MHFLDILYLFFSPLHTPADKSLQTGFEIQDRYVLNLILFQPKLSEREGSGALLQDTTEQKKLM